MGIIGIIGAMASEVELLTQQMEEPSVLHHAGIDFHYGLLAGKPAVVARCGIGKVCAALCAQALIDRFHVGALINTGVAGGLDPCLAVGDLVVGAAAVQHDFDLTSFGHVKGYMSGEDDSLPTLYAADRRLIAAFEAAARDEAFTGKVIEGVIASGDVFVSDEAVKADVRERFGAAAVEMEGAAIAQTAAANGVPCVVVRAISDLAGQQAVVSFDTFEKQAARASAGIVMAMLKTLPDVEEWEGARGA